MRATKSATPSKSSGPQLMPRIPSDNKPLTDLSTFSAPELVELRDRQMHLLANKKRLQSLPDKGERIRALHQRIVSELQTRDAITDAAALFSALNIAATGKSLTTQMEWAGRTISADAAAADAEADANNGPEDADERDPIRLLAQSRQTVKQVTIEAPVESLITAADRADIEELQREATPPESGADSGRGSAQPTPEQLEPHALYMCSIDGRHPVRKDRFLPHKTVIPHQVPLNAEGAADKSAKPTRKIANLWENTAATPPALRNAELVALSLQDSIDIQRKQQDMLKQLDLQHAAERLVAREKLAAKLRLETASEITTPSTTSAPKLSGSLFGTYRSTAPTISDADSDDENPDQPDEVASDEEAYGDDYDEPRGGGVSVVSYD